VASGWVGELGGLTCRFCVSGGLVFWLVQGERDGCADEVEGLALGAGRLGQHRDGLAGAGEADLVTGQGGQVVQEPAEAAVGAAVFVVLAGGPGLGGRGAAWPPHRGGGGGGGAGGLRWGRVSGAQARRRCQVR